MKKFIMLALMILVITTITVLPVSAEKEDAPVGGNLSAVTLVETSTTRFTVEVSVNNNPGFIAVSAIVEYDPKALKLIAADNGSIFSNIYMPGQYLTNIPYKLMWMDATAPENIMTNGVLARYTFEVLEDAPLGNTEIKFNIDDYANFEKSTEKPAFTGCVVNVNVKGMSNTRPQETEDGKLAVTKDNANRTFEGDATVVTRRPPSVNGMPVSSMSEEFNSDLVSENEIDRRERMDNNIVIIVSIVAILVAGGALTLVVLGIKKRH